MDIFEGKLLWKLTDEGEAVVDLKETLENKVVGLYFTTSWSPPCEEFTPILHDVYQQLIQRKMRLEIIHISCDKDIGNMRESLEKFRVRWPYVGFGDKQISELMEKFHIVAVPKLIIISPTCKIISESGRKEVQDRGVVCFKFWQKAAGLDS